MSLLELVRLALTRLGTSSLRTALKMLGMIIGVASVVALAAVGQGATSGITTRLEGLGTNLLTINAGASTSGGTRGAFGSATTLTLDDAEAIGALAGVAGVAPELSASAFVVAGDENTTTTVIGTTADYPLVRAYEVWQGTFLTDTSIEAGLRVAVLGATTASDLGLGADAVGADISIGGLPFRVIGILQTKGSSGFQSADDQVMVPLSTMRHYFSGSSTRTIRSIGVSVGTRDQMETVKALITSSLRERHDLASTAASDFTVTDQTQLISTAGEVSTTMSVLLGGIASISLVVGGIGIMNIMLVSVRERTREIGIRKAIGARKRDILLQFLVEALTISLIGGLLGVIAGLVASAVIGALAGWGFMVSPVTIAVATFFSLLIGVIFGVWPARQAAQLDPITALRYE
ncbi:MAG: ABC transporter permease [Chloroflexi bacterium]|nr:ABC transporter permease [Chloroflexota bacterium]